MTVHGLERAVSGVVAQVDPLHAVAWSGRLEGMVSGSLHQTLEATAKGTKVVRVVELHPRGIMKPLWPLVGLVIRRRIRVGTENVKRFLETHRG
jgi:hypothetical protein